MKFAQSICTDGRRQLGGRARAAARIAAAVVALAVTSAAQAPRFTVVESSITEIQRALEKRRVTSHDLVQQSLTRIALYEDRLNSIISVNPRALEEANARDHERAAGKVRGPLHGIPIALKDNIQTRDMPTTGGALAFAGLMPPYDATLTTNLRSAGAIIVAKTQMTELANWVTVGMPANYNSLNAYGMNPYDPRRDPRDGLADGRPVLPTGGSSSGVGTTVSFWVANVGTETSGSILSPSNQNMLAGIKPTVGRVSRYGIIPITADQDTAGRRNALAKRIGTDPRAIADWEAGSRLPFATVKAWATALGVVAAPSSPLILVVPRLDDRLFQLLRSDPTQLQHLDPEQFEHFTAERLDRMGYNVALTGATHTKDGGIDIVAVPRNAGAGTFLLAVQVKHHRTQQRTGREVVDRLLSWKNSAFRIGMLVTNTQFTAHAKWIAALADNRFFARLRDIEDLKRWLENDFRNEEEFRELPEEIMVAPGLRVAVPRAELTRVQANAVFRLAMSQ